MQKNPLVSIIIPVYNGSNYVKEAIDSALAQTYENIEILVVNDGSKDDGATEKIALSYGDKIRYFHKENGGVSSALNLGIQNMKGEYFSWLSHDDKYEPKKIENQVKLLEKFDDDKLLALCASREIDKNSQYFKNQKIKTPFPPEEIISWEKALAYLFNKGTYGGCALMIPKKAFDECGGFDETLRYTQDSYMWILMFLAGYKLVCSADADSLTRIHNGQLTQTGRAMYHQNCEKMSEVLIPTLLKVTNKKNNLFYYYVKSNAKKANKTVYKNAIKVGKEGKVLTFGQRCRLKFVALYGNVRPTIRKIYYRLFKKVKTQ